MSGADLKFKTWLGEPCKLTSVDKPFDAIEIKEPIPFAQNFNENYIKTMKNFCIKEKDSIAKIPGFVCSSLFFCEGLSPQNITNVLLTYSDTSSHTRGTVNSSLNTLTSSSSMPNAITIASIANATSTDKSKEKTDGKAEGKPVEGKSIEEIKSDCFFFFSAPVLDYVSLHQAIYICFSRIVIPEKEESIKILLEAFADAYQLYNQFGIPSKEDIKQICLATILFSLSHRKSEKCLDESTFLGYLKNLKVPDDFKSLHYGQINNNPVPIFLEFASFLEKPNTFKTGELMVDRRISKKRCPRYFKLAQNELQMFEDKDFKNKCGYFSLKNIVAKYNPGKQPSFTIKKEKQDTVGYVIKKKDKIEKKSNVGFEFNSAKDEELREWADVINYIGFYEKISQMLIQS